MGGREVSRPYRVWFFAEGERFLSFWRCHRPRWRGRRWWCGVADSSLSLKPQTKRTVPLVCGLWFAWNQTCHITNDRCEALASPKGCFLCFLFLSPLYLSTEPKSWHIKKRNPNAESICSGLEYIKNSSYGHKKGQVNYIAPLQPITLASVKTWGIQRELAV